VDDTVALLRSDREDILSAAEAALSRMQLRHYERAGVEQVRERLAVLFDLLIDGIVTRDLGAMLSYASCVAEERFHAGYDLSEVQTAFNALEEATWSCVLRGLDSSDYAEALGLLSTVLGAGKDELARAYVSLATETHSPSLDMRALFSGTS